MDDGPRVRIVIPLPAVRGSGACRMPRACGRFRGHQMRRCLMDRRRALGMVGAMATATVMGVGADPAEKSKAATAACACCGDACACPACTCGATAKAQQVRRRAPLDPLHVRTLRLQSTITSSRTTIRRESPPFPPGSRGPVPPRCGRRPHPASCSGSRSLSGTTRSGTPRPSRSPCT